MKSLLSCATTSSLDDLWLPPVGYHFFKLFATSYSLEERVIGELAIHFIPREYRSGITLDKLAPGQLKALLSTKLRSNFRILYDRSALDTGISENSKLAYFAPYLKGISPVAQRDGLVRFHPKVYWALFRNDASLRIDRARIIVSSQNLNLKSSCKEAGFVIEFEGGGRPSHREARMTSSLLNELQNELSKWDRTNLLATLARVTRRLKPVKLPQNVDEISILNPHGTRGAKAIPFFRTSPTSIIISPFVHKNQLTVLQAAANQKARIAVITRQDTLDGMVSENEDFSSGNPFPNLRFGTLESMGDRSNQDLHAKVYLTSASGKVYLTVGSSNLTRGGWGRNHELNTTLRLCRRLKGFDSLWSKLRAFDDDRLYQRKGLEPTLEESFPMLFAEWVSSWEFSWTNSRGKTLKTFPLNVVATAPSPLLVKQLGQKKLTVISGTVTSVPQPIPLSNAKVTLVAAKAFFVGELLPTVTIRVGDFEHLIIPDYSKFPSKIQFETFDVEDMLEALLLQTGRSRIGKRGKGKKRGKGRSGLGSGAFEIALDKVLVSLFCEHPDGMDTEGYREKSATITSWLERVKKSNQPDSKLLIDTLATIASQLKKRAA